MEKVKVVFEVKYDFRPEYEAPYMATIVARIPKDEDGMIPLELREKDEEVFGEELIAYWGNSRGNYRVVEGDVTGTSWKEVERRVEEVIEEAVNTLRKVKQRNVEALKTKPTDKVYVYEI